MGLASLATAQPERATMFLRDAVREDRLFAPLKARSLEALSLTGNDDAAVQAVSIRAALEERMSGE